jgi:hypothetical protein
MEIEERLLKILLLTVLLSPLFLKAQNLPACDSVFIDCCTFTSTSGNTLNIVVSNYSSDIFSYPGFILYTEEMDTVAIETVNYYGIGWDQTHFLNIIHPIDLPFEGILELHTGFYESQVCTFSILIPDTTLTQIENIETGFTRVYPNPAIDFINLEIKEASIIINIFISDVNGSLVKEIAKLQSSAINISDLKTGLYFIRIINEDGKSSQSRFIKK